MFLPILGRFKPEVHVGLDRPVVAVAHLNSAPARSTKLIDRRGVPQWALFTGSVWPEFPSNQLDRVASGIAEVQLAHHRAAMFLFDRNTQLKQPGAPFRELGAVHLESNVARTGSSVGRCGASRHRAVARIEHEQHCAVRKSESRDEAFNSLDEPQSKRIAIERGRRLQVLGIEDGLVKAARWFQRHVRIIAPGMVVLPRMAAWRELVGHFV